MRPFFVHLMAMDLFAHAARLEAALDSSSTLALALGANLPSAAGDPLETLLAVRPLLTRALQEWDPALDGLRWSPVFRTPAFGGPSGQPDYLNAVLLAPQTAAPSAGRALALLERLQHLEQCFGRVRRERWGPRSLDLDLLWWAGLQCALPALDLPHPRWRERSFVVAPLLALQGQAAAPERCPPPWPEGLPRPLPGRPGWPE